MFSGLSNKADYFNQVITLSTSPTQGFTSVNWEGLVSTLMSLLSNPVFLGFIGIIIIMSILPTVDDE